MLAGVASEAPNIDLLQLIVQDSLKFGEEFAKRLTFLELEEIGSSDS